MATLRTLILAALIAGLQALAPARACSKPIHLVAEEWPPYAFSSGSEQQTGLDIDLTRAILREAGCTLVIAPFVPSVRRLLMFQRGETDLLLAASDTPERRRFARFSVSYRHESIGLFVLARNAEQVQNVAGFDDVIARELSLLAPTTGWYGKDYERAYPRLKSAGKLSLFGTVQQGVRMLGVERALLIMGDSAAIEHEARSQKLDLRALPRVALQAPVHMMFSRASVPADDVEQINAAIGRLERSGALRAIRLRYGVR